MLDVRQLDEDESLCILTFLDNLRLELTNKVRSKFLGSDQDLKSNHVHHKVCLLIEHFKNYVACLIYKLCIIDE